MGKGLKYINSTLTRKKKTKKKWNFLKKEKRKGKTKKQGSGEECGLAGMWGNRFQHTAGRRQAPLHEHVRGVALPSPGVSQKSNKSAPILREASTFLCGNYSDDSEGHSYGQLVIGSFIKTMHPLKYPEPPYIPDLASCHFWLLPKLKSPSKGKRSQTHDERFRKIRWWGSWWQLGELCEVPRCLLWRELRHHCPMCNVSCIFFSKCLYFS